MAKPSIRIWNARIYDSRGNLAASREGRCCLREGAACVANESSRTFVRELFRSVRGELDEARELDLGLGDIFRPDGDLLAVLPLQHQPGDEALAVLDRVGERIVLAVELNAADRAFVVGLLQRIDQLVGIRRASALH